MIPLRPPIPDCPICGAPALRHRVFNAGGAYTRCCDCALIRQWPAPAPRAHAEALINAAVINDRDLTGQKDNKRELRRWELSLVKKKLAAGKLFDVGCGYGFFVDTARQSGYEAMGLEIAGAEYHYARNVLNIPVTNTRFEETALPDNSQDVVTFWEVCDYMPDFMGAFEKARLVLRPGGWVFLRCYDGRFHSLVVRACRSAPLKWLGLSAGILHANAFTPGTLRLALQKAGFENVTVMPSKLTAGDPYRQGGRLGSTGVRLGKYGVERLSRLFYAVTGRSFSSAFVAWARKPLAPKGVLHLITRLDTGGSAENVVFSVEKTDPTRFESLLACGQTARATDVLSFKPLLVPALGRSIHPIKDILAFIQIVRLLLKTRPHILHTHSSKAGLLGRWAAFLVNVFRIPQPASRIRMVHTPHGHVFYGYFSFLTSWFYAFLEKICALMTDRLVALTEGEREESLRFGVGRSAQWRVAHSGVEWDDGVFARQGEERRRAREFFGIPEGALVVGTVGRLEPVKGPVVLARAAEALLKASGETPLYFLFIGDGPEREKIEAYRSLLPDPSRLVLAGHRPSPFPDMTAMDVFVQPSLNEGMGKTLILAQALALPVVASRVCGIPNAVRENVSALLVPPQDPAALAEALLTLLASGPLRRQMGEAGRAWVKQSVQGRPRFSVERMARLLEGVYSELG